MNNKLLSSYLHVGYTQLDHEIAQLGSIYASTS